MKKYIRSPLPYMGNKFKIIEFVVSEISRSNKKYFVDCFGGSGVVTANISGLFEKNQYNELSFEIMKLVQTLAVCNPELFANEAFQIQEFHNVADKKKGYFDFRDYVNTLKIGERSSELFVIVKNCFSHHLMFNANGDVSVASGDNRMKSKERLVKDLKSFQSKMENVIMTNKNYKDIVVDEDYLYYIDPPYLGTLADYNKRWGSDEQRDLLLFCEAINNKGGHFAMSNIKTLELSSWAENNNFKIKECDVKVVNTSTRDNINNDRIEIIITNY